MSAQEDGRHDWKGESQEALAIKDPVEIVLDTQWGYNLINL